jgi:RNA polymerase sigma-70 factor (ECF subfamily)
MEISAQAKRDAQFVAVLQDTNSTDREKQKAFESLYTIHQRQVGIFFKKQMRDEDTAEDLKMITFEKVHENISKYDSNRVVFSTWMYKIALNTLIDHKRKDKFEVFSLDSLATKTSDENEGMEFQILSDILSPEEEMIREQNIKTVRDAIDSIESDKIRRLMTYRFIDELSFEEIAEREGVDRHSSTLRVNTMRGQKILEEKLANA